ncbi:hypothetical protein KCU88_g3188, partial [Aureobasidium melanogenum]
MAPPKTESEDFKFIMTCIKHSPDKLKPNFEQVARETGAKSANACYHKHWGIMRKWGLTGSKKGGESDTLATPRGRKRKATSTKGQDAGDDFSLDDGSLTKKKKGEKKATVAKEEIDLEDDEAVVCKNEDWVEVDDPADNVGFVKPEVDS